MNQGGRGGGNEEGLKFGCILSTGLQGIPDGLVLNVNGKEESRMDSNSLTWGFERWSCHQLRWEAVDIAGFEGDDYAFSFVHFMF